jgi:HD superfamily phosphodiesterase
MRQAVIDMSFIDEKLERHENWCHLELTHRFAGCVVTVDAMTEASAREKALDLMEARLDWEFLRAYAPGTSLGHPWLR